MDWKALFDPRPVFAHPIKALGIGRMCEAPWVHPCTWALIDHLLDLSAQAQRRLDQTQVKLDALKARPQNG
jgi:hypothetical protein